MTAIWSRTLTATAALLVAVAADAQPREQVATLVGIDGTVEVQRAGQGSWSAIDIGAPIYGTDAVRTVDESAAKLVFRDDSVMDLAGETAIQVMEVSADAARPYFRTLVRLARGKVRVLVSENYAGLPDSRYELETQTAIARTRGAAFIAVYHPARELTEVVGIADTLDVYGTIGVIGGPALVQPGERVRTEAGKFPEEAAPLRPDELADYASGYDIVGSGRREGLDVRHPLQAGALLAPEDRPAGVDALPPPADAPEAVAAGAAALAPPPSGDTLAGELSPDIRATDQPIPEYEFAEPGDEPPGSIVVDF